MSWKGNSTWQLVDHNNSGPLTSPVISYFINTSWHADILCHVLIGPTVEAPSLDFTTGVPLTVLLIPTVH